MKHRQIIVAVAMAVAWGVMLAMLIDVQGRNVALELTVQVYKNRFAQRLGDDETYGEYRLLTLDSGLTWWEFDANELPDGSEAIMIVGRADAALVRRLDEGEKDDRTH